MYFRYAISCILLLLLVGCESSSEAAKRSLSIIENYIDIPANAQEVQAVYFQQGQWRAGYLRFKLLEAELNTFLSTTCFNSLNEFYNRYPSFKITTQSAGTPSWWLSNDTNLTIEGRCDQNGISLGIGITEEDNNFTLYLNIFIP